MRKLCGSAETAGRPKQGQGRVSGFSETGGGRTDQAAGLLYEKYNPSMKGTAGALIESLSESPPPLISVVIFF